MSVCPTIGNINLVRVVSATFLHCKVITFPFEIYKLSVGRQFETMLIPCSSSIFHS